MSANLFPKIRILVGMFALLPGLYSVSYSQQIIPAIEREPGRGVEITVSNAAQNNSPIEASAIIRVSENAYGSGFLTLKNISGKPVLGLRGCWEITTSEGGIVRDYWNFGGGTSLVTGGIKNGDRAKLPVSGPPNYTVNKPHRITSIVIRITGVAFDGKTWWGDDGYHVYQKIQTDADHLRDVAEKVRNMMDNTSTETIVKELTDDPTNRRAARINPVFTDIRTQFIFKSYLLHEDNSLREDAKARLDKLVSMLK